MRGHTKRTKTDVIAEYRRNALLDAAVRVFGEHGFDCATMEQIAQQAEVAKGTTYLYYRSKQSIYDAALSRGLAELDDRTREAIDRASTLRDAIPAFVTARTQYFFEHRDFFRMYAGAISRQITSAKPRASEFQAMIDRQTRRLEHAIARAVARREIRHVDAAATAMAIFDLTRGLVTRAVLAQHGFAVDREAAFVSSLVWQGIEKGKGKAPAARARRDQPPPRLRRSAGASAKAEVAERARTGVGPREQ